MSGFHRWREQRRRDAEGRIRRALAESAGWRYSLDLIRETGIRVGRFYPAIHRLEAVGLVEAKWDDTGQPRPKYRRRMYRLAERGWTR